MRLSRLRLFRVSRGSRIVLTIVPLLIGAVISFALWIPPALCGINEDCVELGDPYIASQLVFFSGAGLSALLGIVFVITRKNATKNPGPKLTNRTKWLPFSVLFAVAWLALAVVDFSGQGSRLTSVVGTLIFLGIVATIVLHVREIRRRRINY
jgi:hypothetical protein